MKRQHLFRLFNERFIIIYFDIARYNICEEIDYWPYLIKLGLVWLKKYNTEVFVSFSVNKAFIIII